MINKDIYREKFQGESSDIWNDDDEIVTIPSSNLSNSRPTTSSSNQT
jgi:hypothetical protein